MTIQKVCWHGRLQESFEKVGWVAGPSRPAAHVVSTLDGGLQPDQSGSQDEKVLRSQIG